MNITVSFVDPHGQQRTMEAHIGLSLMEVATRNSVSGIEAECGGACSCGTCHAYIDGEGAGDVPPPDAMEEMMLELVQDPRSSSRLSCQIRVSPELNDLVIRVAPQSGG